jgi:hypothetical protein
MAHDLGLAGDPRLRRRIAFGCFRIDAASAGRIAACGVSLDMLS